MLSGSVNTAREQMSISGPKHFPNLQELAALAILNLEEPKIKYIAVPFSNATGPHWIVPGMHYPINDAN